MTTTMNSTTDKNNVTDRGAPSRRRSTRHRRPAALEPWERLQASQKRWQHSQLVELAGLLDELDAHLPRLDAGQLIGTLFSVEVASQLLKAVVAKLRDETTRRDARPSTELTRPAAEIDDGPWVVRPVVQPAGNCLR